MGPRIPPSLSEISEIRSALGARVLHHQSLFGAKKGWAGNGTPSSKGRYTNGSKRTGNHRLLPDSMLRVRGSQSRVLSHTHLPFISHLQHLVTLRTDWEL